MDLTRSIGDQIDFRDRIQDSALDSGLGTGQDRDKDRSKIGHTTGSDYGGPWTPSGTRLGLRSIRINIINW